jgi:hypothetical protein
MELLQLVVMVTAFTLLGFSKYKTKMGVLKLIINYDTKPTV